ncbi:MAG: hypothetical protein ACK57P_19080, partial [Planctomycetota bacterium]
ATVHQSQKGQVFESTSAWIFWHTWILSARRPYSTVNMYRNFNPSGTQVRRLANKVLVGRHREPLEFA